jgi:catecholate siderophore receptor
MMPMTNQPGRSRLLAGGSMLALLLAAAPALAQESATLPDIQVQGSGSGYNAVQPGLHKLSEPVLDTPTSIDTISGQVIQDRGATNLNDALRNAPGITLGAGEFLWQGNNPYIRGFSARTDMFADGMRDFGDYYRDPFNLEKVEVLEGPASILFGRGSTGGVINQVSKTPQMTGFTNVSISGGTNDAKRGTIDYDTPVDGLGEGAAFRVNAMINDNGVAGRDTVNYQRYGFAPSLALGLGTDTRWLLSYFHQSESDVPDYGIPWLLGNPAPVARNNFYGYDSDYLKNDDDIVTGKVEHDLSGDVTVRAQLRYANYDRSIRMNQPIVPTTVTSATPLTAINVNINSYNGRSNENQFQSQLDVLAKLDTGLIRHDLVAGVEYDLENSTPHFANSQGQSPKSLLSPPVGALFNPTTTFPRVDADTRTHTLAAYAVDTMKLGEQLQLVLGGRIDSFGANFHETIYSVPPATTGVVTGTNYQNHLVAMASWRGALVYKPAENGSVYFSFGTSFNPSAEGISFLNSGENYNVANENLGPEKNQNFEFGTKWQLFDNSLFLSAAVFRTEKTNARIPDPTLPGFNQLAGNQRVDGVELQAQGQITPDWQVSAGYDYLDSTTTKTIAGGPPLGFELPFTPRNAGNVWTTYKILPNLQVGAGLNFTDRRYAQTTAPIESVPGYTTFDAMAKYALSPKFDLQVNVYNLTDKYYYDTPHPHFIIPGAGRSAMLTLNFHY